MTDFITIPELFEGTVERSAEVTWLRYEDSTYTYAEAQDRIVAIGAALTDLGVGRETRVVATARTAPEYLLAWLAVVRLGATFVPVNPKSTAEELTGLIGQVEPPVVITDEDLRATVDEALGEVNSKAQVVLAGDLFKAPSVDAPPPAARVDDVAVMIPTSGTTGRSKLVMQTQRAYAMAGEGFPWWMELTEDDILMTSLPLFHINAPAYSTLGSVAAGAGLVLLPKFSASTFIDSARKYGATEFNAIGAMIEILMRQPERDTDADNPLRLCYTGPAPPKERHLEIEERFGFKIVSGYALSETPYATIWRRGTRPYGTLGSVRQHPRLGEINQGRVIGDDGNEVGVGGSGELELKNPAIMLGYYNMPEETDKVLVDGWLKTGDIVQVNGDETFTFLGRKKELIRRRGENLSPLEVQDALEAHPGVVEAAVIGVPSELSEEEIKAFVVLKDGETVTMTELRKFVAGKVAKFKVPRYFEVLDDLPHTPTGRIAKPELPTERTDTEEDLDPQ